MFRSSGISRGIIALRRIMTMISKCSLTSVAPRSTTRNTRCALSINAELTFLYQANLHIDMRNGLRSIPETTLPSDFASSLLTGWFQVVSCTQSQECGWCDVWCSVGCARWRWSSVSSKSPIFHDQSVCCQQFLELHELSAISFACQLPQGRSPI